MVSLSCVSANGYVRYPSFCAVASRYTTYAALAGVPSATLGASGPRPIDGFDLSEALLQGAPSPRNEIVHKPLNKWWTGPLFVCFVLDEVDRVRPR